MIVLHIDCTDAVPVAAVFADGNVASATELPRHPEDRRGRLLYGPVRDLLIRSGIDRPEAVSVGVGPGPMTGTRLGIAFAQGFCMVHDLPVIPLAGWLGRADPNITGTTQDVSYQIGRLGVASAAVTVADTGWSWQSARIDRQKTTEPTSSNLETLARAVAVATPIRADELAPLYLRNPDAVPSPQVVVT